MDKRNSRAEFLALLLFLVVTTLVLTNGFVARIFAQGDEVDVFASIEPISDVLDKIIKDHVEAPDIDKVVEGALIGMMNSLDRYSSYISPQAFQQMKDETKGQFYGIGVVIRFDDDKNIEVFQPIAESPAAKAGIRANDLIVKIDGVSAAGMSLEDAATKIRGPAGSEVQLTMFRRHEDSDPEYLDFTIKRGRVPLESIKEARVLESGIGYVRISDFKETTARDLTKNVSQLLEEGMTSLVLDLRWNPGGLLTSSKEVCELFLPKNTLVTYTQGRKTDGGNKTEDMRLFTEKPPLLPDSFPIVVLVNEQTASCSEIVTGALQFWRRALVIGTKTFGKGSVQTIIPLTRPVGSAMRLTTALYYTPAQVTIHEAGIKPDVEVPMDRKQQNALLQQMYKSYEADAKLMNEQNHGGVTGNDVTEETVEDVQFKRCTEILFEDPVFENLLEKYHKDTHETQVAASDEPEPGPEDEEAGRSEDKAPEESESGVEMPAPVQ